MMLSKVFTLDRLGWRSCHARQLTPEERDTGYPARVAGVHRSGIAALCEQGEIDLAVPRELQEIGLASAVTVGDWVLADSAAPRVLRRLERFSVIERVAAGSVSRPQAIAANLDTLLVVTSCNHDFNPSRLERYLALAFDGGVEPVVILTKADLCDTGEEYAARVRDIAPRTAVVALNALLPASVTALEPWLGEGQTVALVGSSGVGKSTLINTLTGNTTQATAGIREDDSRGRHTTSARQLLAMPGGAWLIDTPGMRELKVGAVESALGAVFADIEALASSCRFRDCTHLNEAGCAVQSAITAGRLDARRLRNYLKLQREAAHATRTVREGRERERRTGKLYKSILAQRRKERGGKP